MQPSRSSPFPDVALRSATPTDAESIKRWRDEESIRRFQPLGEVSTAQLRAELGRQSREALREGRAEKHQWIVTADGVPGGWITLVVTNWDHGLGEIGYSLSTPFQRQGLMPRALEQLLEELFGETGLERIEARCAVDNEASWRVLEKVGFRREGVLRGYFVLRGRRVDNYLYAILRGDRFGNVPRSQR